MQETHGTITPSPGDAALFRARAPRTASASTRTNVAGDTPRTDLTRVHTVPDPYYVTSQFEQTTDTKVIKFVNLPADASSGSTPRAVCWCACWSTNSDSTRSAGSEDWNVRNRNNQVVASGVYFYHIEAGDARRVGRFTVVNFAQ